jgi:aldose 1-epimerase
MLGLVALSMTAHAGATATRETFGTMPDGKPVEAVVLTNAHGLEARVIAYGASLQSLSVPDRDGHFANIALGYASFKDYLDQPQYFGATVGRYANRIAKGRFALDGKTYQVPVNNGPNSLHGGTRGFDKVLWTVDAVNHDTDKASVTLTYVSPDGDMGYPGKLEVSAVYTLDDKDRLSIEYRATTDRPTIVNLSNHAYWNLSGEGSGSVMDERLTIPGDAYLPVDAGSIPTGEIRKVAGTPFDFRQAKPIGRDIRTNDPQLLNGHGYDHNWVISREAAAAPRMVARVEDPKSGRVLTLSSAQPGLQFYSGNFLDGTIKGKGGAVYNLRNGLCLETQHFPDSPNHPNFPTTILKPGDRYSSQTVFTFRVQK